MAEFEIRWSRQAGQEIAQIPSKSADRVYAAIGLLSKSPRPPALLKLKGGSGLWRLRVGDYRVVNAIDDDSKWVSALAVQHRKDVYRGL